MKAVLAVFAAIVCLAAFTTATPPAWQSSARFGTYTAVGTDGVTYHWNNDAWCPGAGPQTIWVNDNNNWGVTSQQMFSTDCWVQTYPHIGWWGGGLLSSYSALTATESETGPGHSLPLQWEAAYDIWLNNGHPGSDSGYEVMVWTDVANVGACCGVIARPTIAGVEYLEYQSQGGNGPVTDFIRVNGAQTTTTDLKAIIAYVASHGGNYSGPADPAVDTIEFGWEVWGTGSFPEDFQMSQFSLASEAPAPAPSPTTDTPTPTDTSTPTDTAVPTDTPTPTPTDTTPLVMCTTVPAGP